MTFPTSLSVRRWVGAAALVTGSLALAACASDDPVPASGSAAEPTTKPPASQQEPTREPSQQPTSESPSEPSTTVVPVYYVGDGPGGSPALFREFHRVTGDPLTEAARLVAGGGQPDDPDYRTLWPQVDLSVTYGDGVIGVDIPSDAFTERPDGMSERAAELAVQQLVYTLQGVQQERVPVQVTREGAQARLFGLPTDAPFVQASPLRTLNLVNITSPAEGDTVRPGDSIAVSGVANSVEANVVCELLVDQTPVSSRAFTAEGWMEDRLFPFEGVLSAAEAPSGEVAVRCSTDDPSGGAEGNGPSVDTKTITVE
jgi:hypothetical protein